MVITVAAANCPFVFEGGNSLKLRSVPREKGPGPGKYLLPGTTGVHNHDPTRTRGPAYSMGTRHAQSSTLPVSSDSPGPVYFVAPCMTRKGKYVPPAFTIRGKSKEFPPSSSPGPAAYSIEKVPPPHTPAYAFGPPPPAYHGNVDSRSETPAPNAYILPHLIGRDTQMKTTSPAYSMSGRRVSGSFYDDLHKSPGPAAYNVGDVTVTRAKSPSCVIGVRHRGPVDHSLKPGPATYYAEQVTVTHRGVPSYSFGLRHSEIITPILDMVV